MKYLLTLLIFLSPLFVRAQDPPVRVILGGDVMAPLRLKDVAFQIGLEEESYFGSLFEPIRPIVMAADIAFANLETPISKTQSDKPVPFTFNAPIDLVKGLRWSGFGIVNVANNHVLDQRLLGVSETLEAVRSVGLKAVGTGLDRDSALSGEVIEVRGVRVGFLGFTAFINGGSRVALKSKNAYINLLERRDDLFAAVDSMKRRADVVLLSLHWGVEYDVKPQAWQEKLALDLHERGVDVIIGHHPHVLQPVHRYTGRDGRQKITFFSLGNLISNQSSYYVHGRSKMNDGNTRDSLLVDLQLTANGVAGFTYYPLWIDNWSAPEEGIRTVSIRKELMRIERQLKFLRPSPQRSFLLARQSLLNARFEQIYRTLFPYAMPPHLGPSANQKITSRVND